MRLFSRLYLWTLALAERRAAPAWLGGLSFIEAIFFPIPPDVLLAPLCIARPAQWWRLAAITTLASVVGGLVGYALGALALDAVMPWIEAAGMADKMATAQQWFATWGFWAVFLAGFSPIPFKVFTVTAGALGMNLPLFVLAALVGRGGRFFLVAGLSARLGPRVHPWLKRWLDVIGWALVALALAAWLWLHLGRSEPDVAQPVAPHAGVAQGGITAAGRSNPGPGPTEGQITVAR